MNSMMCCASRLPLLRGEVGRGRGRRGKRESGESDGGGEGSRFAILSRPHVKSARPTKYMNTSNDRVYYPSAQRYIVFPIKTCVNETTM